MPALFCRGYHPMWYLFRQRIFQYNTSEATAHPQHWSLRCRQRPLLWFVHQSVSCCVCRRQNRTDTDLEPHFTDHWPHSEPTDIIFTAHRNVWLLYQEVRIWRTIGKSWSWMLKGSAKEASKPAFTVRIRQSKQHSSSAIRILAIAHLRIGYLRLLYTKNAPL